MWKRLALLSCLTQPLLGYYCTDSACDNCCPGVIAAGANWVYFRPFNSDLEVARVISEDTTSSTLTAVNAERDCHKTKFDSGYEIFALYRSPELCHCYTFDLKGSYLKFKSASSDHFRAGENSFLTPLIGFIPDEDGNEFLQARSRLGVDVDLASAEFGWTLSPQCPFLVRLFAGAGYARVAQSFRAVYFDPALSQSQAVDAFSGNKISSQFQGVGPRIGFSADWSMFWGLGLFGEFGSNFLVSRKKGKLFQESYDPVSAPPPATVDLDWTERFCSFTSIVPTLDALVGVRWLLNCWCISLHLHGGYRVYHAFNGLQTLKISGNNFSSTETLPRLVDSTTWSESQSFSLAGWFAGASLVF